MYKSSDRKVAVIHIGGIFMLIRREKIRESRFPIALFFSAGLFVGMLIMNFGKSFLLENTGLLDEYTLYHMKYMTVDNSALFYYVLRGRLGRVLVLAILSTTYLGMLMCIGTVCWYGMCAGAFLAAAVIRYGLKGILLVFAGIFPQYLVYIPAMITLLHWCRNVYRMIYIDRTFGTEAEKNRCLPRYMLQLVGILIVMIVGAALESFLNPYFMFGLLKIF